MSEVALTLLLQSALLPFAAVLAVLIITRKWLGRLAPALAVPLGFFAAFLVIHHWSVVPRQALDWLPYLGLSALVGAVFAQRGHWPRSVWLIVQAALVLIAVTLLVKPALGLWETPKIAVMFLTAGGAWLALWLMIERSSEALAGGWVLLVAAAGLAGVLALESSLLLGQLGGALASALFGWAALNIPQQRLALGKSAAAWVAIALGALTLIAFVYAALPPARIAWLAAACAVLPLAGWVKRWRSAGSEFAIALGAAALAALPVAWVLWQAWQAAQQAGGY